MMEVSMKGMILEALMACDCEISIGYNMGFMNEVGTPDLECIADFVAYYIEKKGWLKP